MRTALLLSVLSLSQGLLPKDRIEPETRIVGGYDIDIGKHGYQISIRVKSILEPNNPYSHDCGGSIYSENIVLTAAHCVIGKVPSQLKVAAGSSIIDGGDGVLVPVKEIIVHENFVSDTLNNDVAILVLSTPLPLNNFTIRPIELIDTAPITGSWVTVTGWGRLKYHGSNPRRLQEVRVPIITNDECNLVYDGRITEVMLCAGDKNQGVCHGDSGGPLTYRNKLAGIVSWGFECRDYYPGVYANVAALRPWILNKTMLYS